MAFQSCTPCRIACMLGGGLLLAGGVLGVLAWQGVFSPAQTTSRPEDIASPKERQSVSVPQIHFTDITKQAGIRFVHNNGITENKLLPETMGSGVAVIDFDRDGKPDLLFVSSCPWPGQEKAGDRRPTLALYHNEGGGTFKEVPAEQSGLDVMMFGMGATVGDCDNDRWPDLFVTGIGGNRLFHNEEAPPGKGFKGRWFRDVTATAGVGGPGGWPERSEADFFKHESPLCFSTSATFLDYDGDGLLDLFVCNYVRWSPAFDLAVGFKLDGKERMFGQPKTFPGAQCFLYRNKGGGRFEDVSAAAGVQVFEAQGVGAGEKQPLGKSLGVVVCDPDEDGWPDIVVANDSVRNFFFHNQPGPNGTRVFREKGVPLGVAFALGEARGAMGIDWGPFYRPGCSALVITNFSNEPNTFLCQDRPKDLFFQDVAMSESIAGPSRLLLKFGVFFFDYDLDGRLDFLTCNGHLDPGIFKLQAGQTYQQPPQLFWNTGLQGRGFEPVTAEAAGSDLFAPQVGRGSAYLDIDGDGDLDVVLTANGGPARLLRNDNHLGHHWVRYRLEGDGVHSNRSAIGARVVLEAGGKEQRREVSAARGYLSQSELVVTFGLGDTEKIDRVTIYWPGKNAGAPTVLTAADLAIDKEHVISQVVK